MPSSCFLNLLALQSILNEPSAEVLFYWIEGKLQDGILLSCLNAQLPRGK